MYSFKIVSREQTKNHSRGNTIDSELYRFFNVTINLTSGNYDFKYTNLLSSLNKKILTYQECLTRKS